VLKVDGGALTAAIELRLAAVTGHDQYEVINVPEAFVFTVFPQDLSVPQEGEDLILISFLSQNRESVQDHSELATRITLSL